VFSSSATVYGDPETVPVTENSPVGATTNLYGRSKYMVEACLSDFRNSQPEWSVTLLRYFNPVGHIPQVLWAKTLKGSRNPYLMNFISVTLVI